MYNSMSSSSLHDSLMLIIENFAELGLADRNYLQEIVISIDLIPLGKIGDSDNYIFLKQSNQINIFHSFLFFKNFS